MYKRIISLCSLIAFFTVSLGGGRRSIRDPIRVIPDFGFNDDTMSLIRSYLEQHEHPPSLFLRETTEQGAAELIEHDRHAQANQILLPYERVLLERIRHEELD